jgi:hypothetical protein
LRSLPSESCASHIDRQKRSVAKKATKACTFEADFAAEPYTAYIPAKIGIFNALQNAGKSSILFPIPEPFRYLVRYR